MDVEEEEEFRRELAELSLSNNAAMRRIRKELKNPYRRLHSIDHDIKFVTGVLDALPGHLPAVANLRCGAWYLSPERAIRERAYFKSTDGHFGQWGFSLRRANLQLLRVIVQQGGLVIVDSTRRGKSFPDALSKTIPFWCCTVSRAAASLKPSIAQCAGWDELYLPAVISPTEANQMRSRLQPAVMSLQQSAYPLSELLSPLEKPLRPIFASPATSLLELSHFVEETMQHAYPIICLSASTCPTDATASKDRFYVQGAADDEESWSLGLNATLFWKHHSDLLSSSEEELHDLILSLVAQDVPSKDSPSSGFRVPNTNLRLLLNPVSHLQSGVLFTREEPASPSDFKLSSFKKGKDSIQKCMNHLIETLKTIKTCQHDAPTEIGYHESVSASEGSDWVAAAAVILLCLQQETTNITKAATARQLERIVDASDGIMNPSRSILKRINEGLINRRS